MNKKIAIIAAIIIAAIAGFFILKPSESISSTETVQADLPSHLSDRFAGNPDASVTIIEYANYTCSHCGDFHNNVFDKLKTEYIDTNKVKFIHREVVTDGPGLLATSLARCLPENQYFGMASMLYKNQQEWAYNKESIDAVKEALSKYSNLAGLSVDALNACFDDKEKQEEMLEHFQALAKNDKIKGTPSIYVNGKYVENWQWDNLKAEIDAALN